MSLTRYGLPQAMRAHSRREHVIVARAAALEAELVVMGSRGRKGLRRLFLGSVAENTVRTRALDGTLDESKERLVEECTRLIIGGMDNADRIMSTEYDIILVVEATEISEDDAEKLGTRLRNGMMP